MQIVNRLKNWLVHTDSVFSRPLTQGLIRLYIFLYSVNLKEAVFTEPGDYKTINQFFIRKIKPELRPVTRQNNVISSPSDGIITAYGDITKNILIQAKGLEYDLQTLINQDNCTFRSFATIYLSPYHYHRVHAPIDCSLDYSVYIPGKTLSVSLKNTRLIPQLYCQNERLVLHYKSKKYGACAVVMVGAQNVSSISTPWLQQINQEHPALTQHKQKEIITYKRGDEIANFNMGSTVILLTEKRVSDYCFTGIKDEVLVNAPLAKLDL